jgi:mannitol/fructose-specific phosphotransferase system IIA component (Ntr-type)
MITELLADPELRVRLRNCNTSKELYAALLAAERDHSLDDLQAVEGG